ncbi:Colicin I receptor [Massilia sp. Bi118]|uniref:TonB-dependent receptor n=1 Tax=Massilia sp. Bi118 TaxID=2822346 RepID=UPI001D1AB8F7|nr:TonB-dependent receptor [Massilia sp. Bi118]CAH0272182.1 Colicin I receptor [Massilia sp. Bi118]
MTETPISLSVRRLFAGGGAVGLALLALPAPAAAQEAAPAPKIQRVEITGSNIRRSEAETASSVIAVNRADIEKSGKATVAELLQTLAVDNQGSVPTTFGNGFASGASGISLRGLGAASTLVLLNGRRMAPYGLADDGQKQFSDLNVIPSDAVDRIEVLKDGASAIYGSDAIAGVVNVILRKDYTGTTIRASRGATQDWDGKRTNVAYTQGFGNLDTDRYNLLFSLEYKKFDEIWYRDRADRDYIGRIDLRPWGYSANEALGGTGAIVPNSGAAGNAINGNVRNPADIANYYNRGNLAGPGFTRTFPGAACANLTSHPQGDPGGGCIIDSTQEYNQIEPKQENLSFFTRGTWQFTPDIQLYSELNWYTSQSDTSTTPSAISTSVGYPGGPVNNAGVQLGASHPDNPYFGTAARLRYLAWDVGPRRSGIESNFIRWLGGAKGSNFGWDWDSSLLFSHSHVNNIRTGYLQRDVTFALLDPSPTNIANALLNSPAYAALPIGTVWRIGENAGLNSPELYAALSPTIGNRANSKIGQWDFKATREFGGMPWLAGPLGLALGGEWRHEKTELQPTSGTERGNIIGLGYSAYAGQRNVFALYGEALAPLPYNIEASAALRWDHFTDVGNSYTPKFGLKWTPMREFALRGTFARGFRAPSPAENGVGGLAAFSTAADPLRCALGVTSVCNPAAIALITSPNPDLSPERSRSYNLGMIWDPLPRTSISVDYWTIKRKNEINQDQVDAAIAAGSVVRDPASVSNIPGDPGAITAVLTRYVNSAQTKVRGLDIDARYAHRLPDNWGMATFDIKYTHMFEWTRTERDGSSRDFAGTHGNCDVTNCTGTPDNRANLRLGWERDAWRVSANVNFRGKLDNRLFKDDPDCASHLANGADAPGDCELASFTTLDLVARWKPMPKWEIFGSIENVFDKVAPLDPLTYGAQAYNPLDYAGARGRYYQLGARYSF